jgi:UMP-CMP kinase
MEEALEAKQKEGDGGNEGWKDGKGLFLVDGFPREMDQAERFEKEVGTGTLLLSTFLCVCSFFLLVSTLFCRAEG